MKKMPKTLYLCLFLLSLGIIAGGVLSLINSITAPIIEENRLAELSKSFEEIGVTIVGETDFELVDGVTAVYDAKFDGKDCYAVNTSNKNQYTTVSVIVILSKADGTVLKSKISGNPGITTHNFDSSFTGMTITSSVDEIANVSGATYTTDSVKACFASALAQYKTLGGAA